MNFLHVYVSFGGMLFLKPLSCSAFVVIMIVDRTQKRAKRDRERKKDSKKSNWNWMRERVQSKKLQIAPAQNINEATNWENGENTQWFQFGSNLNFVPTY